MNIQPKLMALMGMNPTGDLGPFTIYTSRRAGTVWFTKAPPLSPPSVFQIRQRNAFRLAAEAWRALTPTRRAAWHQAARRARLYLHGYNLWVWWQTIRDRRTLATIERLSNTPLL